MTAEAFCRAMNESYPGSLENYSYDLDMIGVYAEAYAIRYVRDEVVAVDISPGDATRYRFIITDAPFPGVDDDVLSIVTGSPGGTMFLPEHWRSSDPVHASYAQSKMPHCHGYTVAFVMAFLAEMGGRIAAKLKED